MENGILKKAYRRLAVYIFVLVVLGEVKHPVVALGLVETGVLTDRPLFTVLSGRFRS